MARPGRGVRISGVGSDHRDAGLTENVIEQ